MPDRYDVHLHLGSPVSEDVVVTVAARDEHDAIVKATAKVVDSIEFQSVSLVAVGSPE